MPFPRPTLSVLRSQAMQDITASDLPDADGFLRRSALRVLAWVQAGLAYLHYGYLDWIALQGTPFTATGEYLEAWASLAPTPVLRLAPQPAKGSATFTGVAGSYLANALMIRGDGTQYQSTGGFYVTGSSITVPIVAVVAGSAGSTDIGTPLTLVNPIAGINSVGSATSAITGGTELETDPSLRSRMLESYANPPSGGDAADYVTWSLQVPGVTRAWTNRNGMGPGTVVVFFMMDKVQAAHNGFPQGTNGVAVLEPRAAAAAGDQLAVANWIYGPYRQPVTALVYAVAPTPQPQNFTFAGLAGISAQQQAAVSAAIAALFVSKGSPLATTGIYQSDVDAAVGAVPGLPAFSTISPTSWPLTPALGSLLTVGTISYVP